MLPISHKSPNPLIQALANQHVTLHMFIPPHWSLGRYLLHCPTWQHQYHHSKQTCCTYQLTLILFKRGDPFPHTVIDTVPFNSGKPEHSQTRVPWKTKQPKPPPEDRPCHSTRPQKPPATTFHLPPPTGNSKSTAALHWGCATTQPPKPKPTRREKSTKRWRRGRRRDGQFKQMHFFMRYIPCFCL